MAIRRVDTIAQYEALFKNKELALRCAVEARRFEIELYWKRAAYFWTIIGASFVAYFALFEMDSPDRLLAQAVVSCVGLTLTLAWYSINRSSAYWHANWDSHIHQLEDSVIGPLHELVIDPSDFSFRQHSLPFKWSSTKIHHTICLYVASIWLFLIGKSLPDSWKPKEFFPDFNSAIVLVITAAFLIVLYRDARPKARATVRGFVEDRMVSLG